MEGKNDTAGSENELLKAKPACQVAGVGLRTMYLMISRGEFPRPVQLSARRVAWLRRDLDEWLAKKIAARDQKAA